MKKKIVNGPGFLKAVKTPKRGLIPTSRNVDESEINSAKQYFYKKEGRIVNGWPKCGLNRLNPNCRATEKVKTLNSLIIIGKISNQGPRA